MRQYLSSLVVVLLGIACGGTTDTGAGDNGSAGSATGGSDSAGSNQGGSYNHGGSNSAGAAGKTSAGSSSGGSSAGNVGTAGYGGTLIIIGNGGTGTGGTGVVNPKCPAHVPTGMCSAADAGTACQYDPSTNCLCYPSAPGTYTFCQKVDPTCTYMAPAPAEGAGGISAKIALPPREVCTCVGTTWSCTFGL